MMVRKRSSYVGTQNQVSLVKEQMCILQRGMYKLKKKKVTKALALTAQFLKHKNFIWRN